MSFLRSLVHVPIPPRPLVPMGRTRICVAGFGISHNTGRAQKLAATIAECHPKDYETWFYFSTFTFRDFLKDHLLPEFPDSEKGKMSTLDKTSKTVANHTSAPFVWLEKTTRTTDGSTTDNSQKIMTALGGRDKFCEWAANEFPDQEDIQSLTSLEEPILLELFFDNTTPGGTWMPHDKDSNK